MVNTLPISYRRKRGIIGLNWQILIKRRKVMNNLVKEALEIAIENWEFDGEYDKANQAFELIKGEASE